MKGSCIVLLAGLAGALHADELLPEDAELAGEYIMATYHAKLLSESRCGKYASFGAIDVDEITKNVVSEFPAPVRDHIAAALNSNDFQNQAKLLRYGGIDGMVQAQMSNGLSEEAACARIAGALEQSFRTLEAKWLKLTEKGNQSSSDASEPE